jgi:RNA-directed DNA polymerase
MTATVELASFFTAEALKAAYWKYKASKTDLYNPNKIKIPMGADGITWENFERQLDINADNISRRVLNGSYQFYPLREVEVPKPDGGKRILSVASIRDALVQRQLYTALYDSAEAMFAKSELDRVSFAYRRGKSAPYAAHRIWESFQRDGYSYAFDADIRKFFDTLNHRGLMDLIDRWVGNTTMPGTLLWRYIRTDRVPYDTYPHYPGWQNYFMKNKPQRMPRLQGVPQGGVLSGMLANVYLHEFDRWIVEELGKKFDLRYYRYADDFVVLTRRKTDAEALHEPIAHKLRDLRLEIHPDKTRIVSIADDGLSFVGFHFTQDHVRAKSENIQRFKERFYIALTKEQGLRSQSYHLAKRLRLAIRWCVNPKILGPTPELCKTCGFPKERRRNWMAFFASVTTDVDQLRQLDRWMRRRVCKYFRDRYRGRLGVRELRQAGMKSLVSEYYRQRRRPLEICTCTSES